MSSRLQAWGSPGLAKATRRLRRRVGAGPYQDPLSEPPQRPCHCHSSCCPAAKVPAPRGAGQPRGFGTPAAPKKTLWGGGGRKRIAPDLAQSHEDSDKAALILSPRQCHRNWYRSPVLSLQDAGAGARRAFEARSLRRWPWLGRRRFASHNCKGLLAKAGVTAPVLGQGG